MNQHVTSLELSRKLDKAGVKQESEFYWDNVSFSSSNPQWQINKSGKYSAFLASELLEMLPDKITASIIYTDKKYSYAVGKGQLGDNDLSIHQGHNKSLPKAAGEMVLWCKENGHL